MKVTKGKCRVLQCGEFNCPFFHAGIMGQLTCMIARKEVGYNGGNPPSWCPLRNGPVKVSL